MVGSRFCELSKLELVQADLKADVSVDITDKNSVNQFFEGNSFKSVVLFSAFTDVDAAEKQRNDKDGLCWKINVSGAANVIEACKNFQRKLIFISTDFVFDGSKGPYAEDDKVGPDLEKVSWYGITKIEGEKLVCEQIDDYIVIRISYPYRSNFEQKLDFARQILRKYDENDLYPLFSDQQITPTFIDDLAPCIYLLLLKDAVGIFHLGSPAPTSPYEFGRKLIEVFQRNPGVIKEGSLSSLLDKDGVTPRPQKGGMKTDKIESLGFTPTDWSLGLENIFKQSG